MEPYTTIDDYISTYPQNIQTILQNIRLLLHKNAPEATETISYGIPTFKLSGKNLVHFAAYEHHIGFYPGPDAITKFATDLTGYKTSKGTIQFPLNEKIPYELIERIVKRGILQNT